MVVQMNQGVDYARDSTEDHHLTLQRDALQQAICSVIQEEDASGKSVGGLELAQSLAQ